MAADVNKVMRSLRTCRLSTKEFNPDSVDDVLEEMNKACMNCEYVKNLFCIEDLMRDAEELIRARYKEEIEDEKDADSM